MTMSFVTVTFNEDFDLLETQLETKQQCYQQPNTHYIVLNDKKKYFEPLQNMVNKYNADSNIQVLHFLDLIGRADYQRHEGWLVQQILKLYVSMIVQTKYYVALDSKNFFVRPCTEEIFVKNDRPQMVLEEDCNFVGEFSTYMNNAYKLFDQQFSRDKVPSSRTPFVMCTQWVRHLIENMDTKSLIRNRATVEFYLYGAWIQKNQLLKHVDFVDIMPMTQFVYHTSTGRNYQGLITNES